MESIKKNVNNLKENDIYTLILFALYKIKDIPEYSTLSELTYILDKDNLLNLCEYFGGLTITIPTIDELKAMVFALMLYEDVNINHMDFEKSYEKIKDDIRGLSGVRSLYFKLCEVLEDYDIS